MKYALFVVACFLLTLPSRCRAEEPKVSVGVITALSGGMATIGTAVKNGIELARSEHPELFQRLELHFEDDQFDARKSISAYQKLKSVDHIDLLLGFGVVLGHSVGPLVERDKIPLINFTFEAGPAVGRTYVIRATNHTGQYEDVFARYMKARGLTRSSTIRTEIPFFSAMEHDFREAIGKAGQVRDLGVFNPGDSDFRAIIQKLRKADEPIGLFLLPEQLVQFAKQAKELGLNLPLFGTDLFESAARMSNASEFFEGALYPDNEPSSDFRRRYLNRFGDDSQLTFAGSGYDMALLVGERINGSREYRAEEFLKSLSTVTGHPGVLGPYTYRNKPEVGAYFEYPIRVKRIVEGRGVAVPES